jgi:hypothetical protein
VFGESLATYFADFGIQAVFNGDTALVLLDQHDEDVLQGRAQSTAYVMTLATADFPDLGHGDAVTIDGTNYQVHLVDLLDDGALKQAKVYRV